MVTSLDIIVEISYMIAVILFIVGLKKMTSPATARFGNQLAALAMLVGLVVTLFDKGIIGYEFIIGGVIIGSLIGGVAAKKVAMTSMPEMVALFNGVGGASSFLVGLGEYYRTFGQTLPVDVTITIGLSILVGGVTFTGSVMAYAKLNGNVSGNPITFPMQTAINAILLIGSLLASVYGVFDPTNDYLFLGILAVSLILGVLVVLPIGGADMPVVISLLNSYSGVAAAMTGFVINNKLLIVSGALVGSAGLILTIIMCKAMNRSLTNVLFGAFGGNANAQAGGHGDVDKTIREVSAEDIAVMTAYAQRVVIVPGYGLAVAQAQHAVREVADILESKGVDVKYGIHPVAGRMPGHMNVLLAEANVPYNLLYDMEDINPEFEKTDVVLIIGANDVVNPDARENPASPIYGMPILNVDKAKATVVFKRSMNPGFAGIDNILFYKPNNYMFFGDAKKSLQSLVSALKEV